MAFRLCVLLALAVCAAGKPFPVLPARFYVELALESPQWTSVGLPRVAVPIKAWIDNTERRQRLEYYPDADPVVSVISKATIGYHAHVSFVRDTVRVCEKSLLSAFGGLASVFPSPGAWTYNGVSAAGVDVWSLYVPEGGANNNYTFGVNATTGSPVFFDYIGFNGFLNAPNYDWFNVRYQSFKPGFYNASAFGAPCNVDAATTTTTTRIKPTKTGGFDVDGFRRLYATEGAARAYVPLSKTEADLPGEVDWVAKGKVFAIKDQADCGSCWSFGSAAAVESAYAIKHGRPVAPLSEQVLMDCSWHEGNKACNGGSQAAAFKSMLGRPWPSEVAYPYRGQPGTCHLGTSNSSVVVTDYKYIVGAHAMMDALANHGPVAVAISTFPAVPFNFYHSGVFSNWRCNPIIPDHVVLAVGYGTDQKTGEKYWRLKNQWSRGWGEDGYMRITRTGDDCGIWSFGVLPIVQ